VSQTVSVIYQKPEHYFLVYLSSRFVVACQNSLPQPSLVFKVAFNSRQNRVYIVYVVDSYLMALYVDLAASPSTCSSPREVKNGATRVGAHSDYRYLFLYSNLVSDPVSQNYVMAAAIERKEGSLIDAKLEYYTNTNLSNAGAVSVSEGLYDTVAGGPPGYLTPADEKIEYCQTIEYAEKGLILELITACTVYNWTNQKLSLNPIKMLVVNHSPQQKTTFFHMYSVDFPSNFFNDNKLENLRCSFSERNLVACLIKDERAYLYVFKLKRFRFDSTSTSSANKCSSQSQFCFELEGNSPASKGGRAILLSKEAQFESFYSLQVGNYSVVLAFEKPSTNCSILIYKLNSTEFSIAHPYGPVEKTRDVTAGQFNQSQNGFFIYNPADLTYRVFDIADYALKFTTASLKDLQGLVAFSNARIETKESELDLRSVFREDTGLSNSVKNSSSKSLVVVVVVVVLFAGLAAGLAVYYLLKRRRLMKELAEKETLTINSLDQFYYHKR